MTTMVLVIAGSLVSAAPAHAAPPGWDVCGRVDSGQSLCFFDYNPPESWPDGFSSVTRHNLGRCQNLGQGWLPAENTTSYLVNHSNRTWYLWDGRNCSGATIAIFPGEAFGMPRGWNDRISSVQLCCAIETR
jgi:hypothetical protein